MVQVLRGGKIQLVPVETGITGNGMVGDPFRAGGRRGSGDRGQENRRPRQEWGNPAGINIPGSDPEVSR